MAENYQSKDVWSRTTTINGYAVDEIRSVLQKSIRRGKLEEATLAAYELFASGPETEEVLWRRLEIIATEDVGFGLIEAPMLLEALNQQRLRMPEGGERWMYSAHAVRLLTTAKKDRTSMELAGWAHEVIARRERKVEIEDYIPTAEPAWVEAQNTGGPTGRVWTTRWAASKPSGAIICGNSTDRRRRRNKPLVWPCFTR
jgi:replication-associated recombination protein RarA